MPKVLNKRLDPIPPDAVYVGRPSKWGNPYRVEEYGRTGSIFYYKAWLIKEMKVSRLDVTELAGKDLVCHCTPLPCHADVLLELANESGA